MPTNNGGTGSSTITGSGLPVFQTSPTITNPTESGGTYNSATIPNPTITYNNNSIPAVAIVNNSIGPNQFASNAQSAYVATSETSTTNTYVDLATTTDSVTVTIGPNGLAIVFIFSYTSSDTVNDNMFTGFALSGANTLAANDNMAQMMQPYTAGTVDQRGTPFLLTGLTAGSTTFKMKYKSAAGNTCTWKYRRISVIPL